MSDSQNLANEIKAIDEAVKKTKPVVLTIQQQYWIDYNALNGLITDVSDIRTSKDGNPLSMRKMPITEFSEKISVSRETLRKWRNEIPDFWGRVNARRRELAPQSRLARIHEVWYLAAQRPGKDGFQDRQLWLANFDEDFRMPTQPVKHDLGDSWAALLQNKRSKAIEGEIVDANENN